MKNFEEIKNRFKELELSLISPEIASNNKEFVKISREHSNLKSAYDLILALEKIDKTIEENEELAKNEKDGEIKKMALDEIDELKKERIEVEEKLNEELFEADPNDTKDVIIEIRAGAGGDEGALFTSELSRSYLKFCEKNSWKTDILSSSPIGIGGYKEIIFSAKGNNAYLNFKHEAGTHRVQRVPETEKQGRVHTSTATVIVLPEAEEIDIKIDPNDLRIDTFCSSGPGGQSVNTTYSAVRITHIPTNTVVSCQDEKSQHQNKEKAMKIIRSRILAKIEEERIAQESEERKTQVGKGNRVDKIRTYNFPQSRVTDHRINKSWHNIDEIMNGDLDEMIKDLKILNRS